MNRNTQLITLGVLALVGFAVVSGSFTPTAGGEPNSSVYANVFVTNVGGHLKKLSILDASPLSILGFKPQRLATISAGDSLIYDSTTGKSGDIRFEHHLIVKVTSGTPQSWETTAEAKLLVDGVTKDTVRLVKSGVGVPPGDVLMGSVARLGSTLASDFGAVGSSAVGHVVSTDISGTAKIVFAEGPSSTVAFGQKDLSKVSLSYSPGVGTFTVTASVGSTATSSDPLLVASTTGGVTGKILGDAALYPISWGQSVLADVSGLDPYIGKTIILVLYQSGVRYTVDIPMVPISTATMRLQFNTKASYWYPYGYYDVFFEVYDPGTSYMRATGKIGVVNVGP